MAIGLCSVPAAPIRKQASHDSEMVNQLLFGERVDLLEQLPLWTKIRSHYDQYEGWVSTSQFFSVERNIQEENEWMVNNNCLFYFLESNKGTIVLPQGSVLPNFIGGSGELGDLVYSYKGGDTKAFGIHPEAPFFLKGLIDRWMNVPYLWGGRTGMGVDCSGFTQVLFKMLGVRLLRDAWQQAGQGETVDFLQAAKLGDLAFFDDAEGKINHVGILLNPEQIVHASGKVRIDSIDNAGILQDGRNRTHSLRIIKRYF